jgi:hypothetical protein
MGRTHDVTISAFDLDRLESEIIAVEEQRDRLAVIASELIAMIRMNVSSGLFGKYTIEQLDEHLKPWIEKIAVVKGGDDES